MSPVRSPLNSAPEKKTRSAWRIVGRVAMWTAATIGAAVVVLLILVFHKAASPIVQTDLSAASRLATKLDQVQAAAAAGTPQALQVDQGELNSFIESRLKPGRSAAAQNAPVVVRDVKLNLIEDRMRIYVLVDFHGKDMTLQFETKMHTENGYERFELLSGKIGALPIPKSRLESSMRDMWNSPQGREYLRLPSNLKDVHVEDGKMVVTFK